ncbi:MAG: class I SAM-dependent methyltransferase, partial [Gammaproteobacteria bacterium]
MTIISHGKHAQRSDVSTAQTASSEILAVREALQGFELGRFLLSNLGLNGYWTSYILLYPERGRLTRLSSDGSPLSACETWLLERCPMLLATQERFRIFKALTQSVLKPSMQLASIPCGLMDDLLSLDYTGLEDTALTGVDLDREALQQAQTNYVQYRPPVTANFECRDAWRLDSAGRWDLVTSNGLNIYVQDEPQCTALYRGIHTCLKPAGYFVMSFITPPALWSPRNADDLAYQKFLFTEVLPVKWQCFRTEETTRRQLE